MNSRNKYCWQLQLSLHKNEHHICITGPVSPVDKGSNNKGNATSFSKSDLTPEQVNIMNQFVRGGIMTEEQYINDIAKMQE